jgi:hypothetical protein
MPEFRSIIDEIGPFESTEAFLRCGWEEILWQSPPWCGFRFAVIELIVESIPSEIYSDGDITLSHSGFNSQNIFVGNYGEITGIIDWDGVQTSYRSLAFAQFPLFIFRDWDPHRNDHSGECVPARNDISDLKRY